MFLCGRCLSAQLSALLNNLDTVGIMSYRERAQTQLWTPVTVIAVVRLDGSSNDDRFKDLKLYFAIPTYNASSTRPHCLYAAQQTQTAVQALNCRSSSTRKCAHSAPNPMSSFLESRVSESPRSRPN